MRIYLAVTGCHYTGYDMMKGCDILSSYYYCKALPELVALIPEMRDFMLDSGVFSFINSGKKVDYDRYIHEYADFIRENNIKSYVELDVDQLVGVKETRKLRDRLEGLVGWRSIPVWHTIRGKESFIEDCKEYPRICLGFYLTEGLPAQLTEKHTPWFIDKAHEHNCRIHGLGFTKTTLLPKFHFDSVDSSSWSFGQRYGNICYFDKDKKTMYQSPKPRGTRLIIGPGYEGLMKHNFKQWQMYQNWARQNLPIIW